jgi:hypothetical protein
MAADPKLSTEPVPGVPLFLAAKLKLIMPDATKAHVTHANIPPTNGSIAPVTPKNCRDRRVAPSNSERRNSILTTLPKIPKIAATMIGEDVNRENNGPLTTLSHGTSAALAENHTYPVQKTSAVKIK